jgi:hypothetical protein
MPGAPSDEKKYDRKPNWVEKGTLFTLVVTLIAVAWYALEAHWANDLTRRVIETNIRTYITINILADAFAVKRLQPEKGGGSERMTVELTIENTGKLPAPARVQAGVDWQSAGHQRASTNAPQATSNIGQRYLFPSQDSGRFTVMTNELAVGDIAELRAAGFKRFYVAIWVGYGAFPNPASYETRVCNTYPIEGPFEALRLGQGEPCGDESSNSAR